MNRVPTISAKISVVEVKINSIDKQINQLEAEKALLLNEHEDLQEKLMLAEGEVFADECLEGKHPVVYWCDLPQYMRNVFNDFYQEILQGVDDELTEKSAGKYMGEAIEKFKKFYKIDRIEYSYSFSANEGEKSADTEEQLLTD